MYSFSMQLFRFKQIFFTFTHFKLRYIHFILLFRIFVIISINILYLSMSILIFLFSMCPFSAYPFRFLELFTFSGISQLSTWLKISIVFKGTRLYNIYHCLHKNLHIEATDGTRPRQCSDTLFELCDLKGKVCVTLRRGGLSDEQSFKLSGLGI